MTQLACAKGLLCKIWQLSEIQEIVAKWENLEGDLPQRLHASPTPE